MRRKINISLCFLSILLSPALLAAGAGGKAYWLAGVSGGYATNHTAHLGIDLRYTNPTNPVLVGVPPTYFVQEYSDDGFFGGILIGRQLECHEWIFGLELSVDSQGISKEHTATFSDVYAAAGWFGVFRYRREVVIDLTARIGYELESYTIPTYFIPYIRFGIETSKNTLQTQYYGSNPATYPFTVQSTYTRWPYNFVGGAGVEIPLKNSPISARIEYIYHARGQRLETYGVITDGGIATPVFASSSDPLTRTGKISLVWNFC